MYIGQILANTFKAFVGMTVSIGNTGSTVYYNQVLVEHVQCLVKD